MTDSEWNAPASAFEKLVEVAITLPDWERKCRLVAVAICQQDMALYPEPECVEYLAKVVEFANNGGDMEAIKKMAGKKPIMTHGGLFHCIRLKSKTAILETHNKYIQDARKFYNNKRSDTELKRANCDVLRHVFGPLMPVAEIQKNGKEAQLKEFVNMCLETGQGWGPLSDFVEEFYGRDDLASHLRNHETHPEGCYVLDILKK